MQNLKVWADLLIAVIAVPSGLVAVLKALAEWRESRRQRFAELRWRRANAAREILHEVHAHRLAAQAVSMLDWSAGRHSYEYEPGRTDTWSYDEVKAALQLPPADCHSGRDVFICDCFDWFFYFVNQLEHYIVTELIDFEDVAAVFRPYANKVRADAAVFAGFWAERQYDLAPRFFARYDMDDGVRAAAPGG